MKSQNRGKAETVTDQKAMIITQLSLKAQHLHHWQEKRLDCLLLAQFRIFPRPHIQARKETGLLHLFSSISSHSRNKEACFYTRHLK